MRKWLVQQQTPFSARANFQMRRRDLEDRAAVRVAEGQAAGRRPRHRARSFSASATVEHSSSTRRNAIKSGVPFQLNFALSLVFPDADLVDRDRQTGVVHAADDALDRRDGDGREGVLALALVDDDQRVIGDPLRRQPVEVAAEEWVLPVVLRSVSTTTVEQPIPLDRSAMVFAKSRSDRSRPEALAAASISVAMCLGKCGRSLLAAKRMAP